MSISTLVMYSEILFLLRAAWRCVASDWNLHNSELLSFSSLPRVPLVCFPMTGAIICFNAACSYGMFPYDWCHHLFPWVMFLWYVFLWLVPSYVFVPRVILTRSFACVRVVMCLPAEFPLWDVLLLLVSSSVTTTLPCVYHSPSTNNRGCWCQPSPELSCALSCDAPLTGTRSVTATMPAQTWKEILPRPTEISLHIRGHLPINTLTTSINANINTFLQLTQDVNTLH